METMMQMKNQTGKRRNNGKRMTAVLLSLILILGTIQTAFAAEQTEAFRQATETLPVAEETVTSNAFAAATDVIKEMDDSEREQATDESLDEPQQPTVEPTEYIPVLMYHHFALRDMGQGDGVTTMQAELEEQVRYFKEQGYSIISLEDLNRILTKKEREKEKDGDIGLDLKVKYLCITMDDGYFSNYDLAYPVFQKYHVPASIFAITDSVTNQIGLKKFSWSNAAQMVRNSKVRIYNHTSNHIPVSQTTTEAFVAAALAGEEALKEYLPVQQDTVKALAYPNGQTTPELQEALLEEGFSLMFTVEQSVITRNTSRGAIPRIMVSSGMTGEDVIHKIEQTANRVFAAG